MSHRERQRASERDSLKSSLRPQSADTLPPLPKPRSKAYSAVLHQVERFAQDDTITIVFEGESGTGKTHLARLTHSLSRRAANVFHEIFRREHDGFIGGLRSLRARAGCLHGCAFAARERFKAPITARSSSMSFGKASEGVQRNFLRVIEDQGNRPGRCGSLIQGQCPPPRGD